MPISDPVSSLIGGGIGAVSNIFGSKTAAKAAKEAAKIQAQSVDRALDFEKSQYANEQTRLDPYRQLGSQALARMGQRLGGGTFTFVNPNTASRPTDAEASRPSPQGGTFTFANPIAPARPSPQSNTFTFAGGRDLLMRNAQGSGMTGGGMVRIRHPRTGEVRVVPAAQVAGLKAKGGVVV